MVPLQRFDMRADPETARLMDLLSRRLGIGRSGVMRLAIRRLAQLEGIPVEDSTEEKDAA
jgi:antitoxin component of RelBE/YafQ-DinJ toxin-antitoxin module